MTPIFPRHLPTLQPLESTRSQRYAELALSEWGIAIQLPAYRIGAGKSRTVIYLEDDAGGRFVLHEAHSSQSSQILAETGLLQWWTEAELIPQVPDSLPCRSGSRIACQSGKTYYLSRFVPGFSLKAASSDFNTAISLASEMGRCAAMVWKNLSALPSELRLVSQAMKAAHHAIGLASSLYAEAHPDNRVSALCLDIIKGKESAIRSACSHAEQFLAEPGSIQCIHADLRFSNVIFGADRHVSCLLDFESWGEGPVALELALVGRNMLFSDEFGTGRSAGQCRVLFQTLVEAAQIVASQRLTESHLIGAMQFSILEEISYIVSRWPLYAAEGRLPRAQRMLYASLSQLEFAERMMCSSPAVWRPEVT